MALLASCEGRCRAHQALMDEVPGAQCATAFGDDSGLCLRGTELYTCSIQGMLWHEASCVRAGEVKP